MPVGKSHSFDLPSRDRKSSPSPPTSPTSPRRKAGMSPLQSSAALFERIRHPIRALKGGLVDDQARSPTTSSTTSKRTSQDVDAVARASELRAEAVKHGALPPSTESAMLSQDALPDEEPEPANDLYGRFIGASELSTIAEVAQMPEGSDVSFRARITTQRRVSAALDFLLFRDQTHSIQGVLANAPHDMIKWVQHLPLESLVHVTGKLRRPPVGEVRSATHHDLEVAIETLHVVNPAHDVPFDNYKPLPGNEIIRHRLTNRVLDLRHPSNYAIFKVRHMITRKFRESLDDQGFIEINTPKLQPAATESGASVFKINYFGRTAFLAQSPQLAKQMTISADFGRVYEIGPVFRAEKSFTHRHLTEYTGLDLEMALANSYQELLVVLDRVLKSIFTAVQQMPELAIIRERFPSTDLEWLDETLVLTFSEGIQMLRDDGVEVEEEDLATRDEIRLGQLVKDKYKTDYFILDKFPASARPFYTHPDGNPDGNPDGKWTNSFDIFLRGQEICSGGQRIHDAKQLKESMALHGLNGDGMEEYLNAFEIGAPPHGGAGLGLERIVMLLLELGDVRHSTLYYRDPKSLPARPPALPHPDADTTKERTPGQPLPPVEDLIANYGDATNTSWLDDRFQIWRHRTGAAVGYVPGHGGRLVTITGNPLCDERQYEEVISAFLEFVHKELHMNPVWLLVSDAVQEILARRYKWRTLTCVEEQRVVNDKDSHHRDRAKKQRRANKEGISVAEVHPDDEFKRKAEIAVEAWKQARSGKRQIHLTEVRLFVDERHRRYFAAEKDGQLLALVVLAQLSHKFGSQVKWSMSFPGAPSSAIDVCLDLALDSVPGAVTFGAGASEKLTPVANISGARAKLLVSSYNAVMDTLGIAGKNNFRQKFGTFGDAVYICFGKGVSVWDLRGIIKFFEDQ